MERRRRTSGSSAALVLAASLAALFGCGDSVPSPWKERGVPTTKLDEVDAGTNADSFSATYSDEAHRVLPTIRDGLVSAGMKPCGQAVRNQGAHVAFLLEGETLWKLQVSEFEAGRSGVSLGRMDAKRGWGHDYTESGCEAPGFGTKK